MHSPIFMRNSQRQKRQKNFFKSLPKDHGGMLSINKRRGPRPLSTKSPLHIVLRSDLAKGPRSLLKHKTLIRRITLKSAKRFRVQVYEKAICSNHLHMLVRAKSRSDIQNFFRVLAGHIAQEILRQFPLSENERGGASKKFKGCKKNQRKFWTLLIYSRIVSWGGDFLNVSSYIIQNTLEAMGIIPYQQRKRGGAPIIMSINRNTS